MEDTLAETTAYLLPIMDGWAMLSARFRDDVSTVPGMAAVLLVCAAFGMVVIDLSVTLVVGFWLLVVGLWIVYLLYRLVVAVETLADRQTTSS